MDGIRPVIATDRDGQCFGIGSLSIAGTSASAQVADAVPDLDDQEAVMKVVPKRDVDAAGGIRRARRNLEISVPAMRGGEAEDELLTGEMAGIRE